MLLLVLPLAFFDVKTCPTLAFALLMGPKGRGGGGDICIRYF